MATLSCLCATHPPTNSLLLSNQPIVIDHTYDPEVEFLEVAVTENGRTTWKLIGPDMDGRYGGQNGTGGFDAFIPGPELFCPILGDAFGNLHAVYDQTHGSLTWYASRVTGYGAVPGYRPVTLGTASADLGAKYAWRNRAQTGIGYVWMGGTWLKPDIGETLSFDPYGYASSDSGHTPFNGNPWAFWDADGRLSVETYWRPGLGAYSSTDHLPFQYRLDLIKALAGVPAEVSHAFYGYQPPQQRSFAEAAGDFAFDAVLNAELIQQSYQELSHRDFSSAAGVATFITAGVGMIAGPIDAVVNVATLGGKGAVQGTVKAGLKEVIEVGAKETVPMFSKTVGQAMDHAEFARIKTAFERTGGVIDQSAEGVRRLDYFGAEASTLGNYITLRPDASRSAVFEELIHATQNRLGRNDWSPLSQALNEIEAQEKLIRFRRQYRIPNDETRQTIQALRDYREQLKRIQGGN
jgi:hypothetical protein